MSKLSVFLEGERAKRGWSRAELARQSGVPLTTLTRYERVGFTGKPDHENILNIAKALEKDPNDVLITIGYPLRQSVNTDERDKRWADICALLDGDARAERIYELYRAADDEERDSALSLLEVHFNRPRRRARRR